MKETIEQAAENTLTSSKDYSNDIWLNHAFCDGFMRGTQFGANWHKERVIEMIDREITRMKTLGLIGQSLLQLKQQILNDGK